MAIRANQAACRLARSHCQVASIGQVHTVKQKLEKWESWLEIIYQEIVHLAASRQIYTETVKIILSNESLPKKNNFLDFLEEWYVHSIVMGLRRQLKTSGDSISLTGLLRDIVGASCLLSRERFVSLVNKDGRGKDQPNSVFDKYAGEDAEFIDSQQVCEDLGRFKDIAAKCEEYADRFVAHGDKRGISSVPTYKEPDEAFAFMNELLKKYFLLIRGDTLKTVTPVFQRNWKVIFKQPWIRGDQLA